MPIVIGGGVVANIIGGIAGKEAGRDAAGEANNAMNIAFQELQQIGLPPDLSKKIIYEQFKQAGKLTPELEQQISAGPSQLSKITEDPNLKGAQMEALKILQERGKGGLNPEDRAALNEVRQQVATDAEAKRQQILQNFQARGQGGSGAELIAALQASQSGANEASQQGDRLAAMASQNALSAINQAGNLGGQIRGQEFGQKANVANAEDVMKKFDVQNQIGVGSRNVGYKNAAQEKNLDVAQQMSNMNTAQTNAELQRANEAQRQKWLDEMQRSQIRSGARMGQAQQLQNQSAAASASAAAPWQAIGSGLSAFGTASIKPTPEKKYDGGPVEDYREGGKVPGKAKHEGDHPENDTVPIMASPGELVVPRTVAKTNFGKKLAKLLEDHHELRKQLEGFNDGGQVLSDEEKRRQVSQSFGGSVGSDQQSFANLRKLFGSN